MLREYEVELLAEDIIDFLSIKDFEELGIKNDCGNVYKAVCDQLKSGNITPFKKYFRDYFPSDPHQISEVNSILQRLNQHAAIYVAVESTSDYSDESFRAERTNSASGLMVRDKYRVVFMDGSENLVPINDLVFNSRNAAIDYIYDNPQYEQVTYDELIEMIPTDSLSVPEAYGLDSLKENFGSIHF